MPLGLQRFYGGLGLEVLHWTNSIVSVPIIASNNTNPMKLSDIYAEEWEIRGKQLLLHKMQEIFSC